MNCEYSKERLTEWLTEQLPEQERVKVDSHLTTCPDCQREFEANKQLWSLMGQLPTPEPSKQMKARFDTMLDLYKDSLQYDTPSSFQTWLQRLQQVFTPKLMSQLAYGTLLLLVGGLLGYWISYRQTPNMAYKQQIDTLSTQVQEMRQMMMLSLLENPSATERLRAVSYTSEINEVDSKIIDALLTTLNNDPNVNVRLVTIEALIPLANNAVVREGLVHSLTRQESPLVQVALADAMVKLQEKRSIKVFKKLLQQNNLDILVKNKLEQTIKDLS
ncbi:MAG: HEAT repeat domain-containing protein [Spirosomataceae bacterium]